MRLLVGTVTLAMALAACAGGRPAVVPSATPAQAATSVRVAGYDGPIEPIPTPVELAYGTARFGSTVTIGVEGGQGAAGSTNSLAVHLSGNLVAEGDRVRGELVTERVDVDGRSPPGDEPMLIQQLMLDRHGRLIDLSSRWPVHIEPSQPLPARYKALEDRWRERLPVLTTAPVTPGSVVYEETGLLTPLQQMLQSRAYQLKPITPLRAVAVGLAPCGKRRCLIARHEGEAELVAERGTLHVTTGGYVQIELSTGLILNENATVTLERPDGRSRLVMTMRTATQLL